MARLYTYNQMDLARDSIRLLYLCRDDEHATEIHCEMFEGLITDSDRIPYEALSYTWGDKVVTKTSPTIWLNGQKVSVTHNLFDALYYLRQRDHDRVLWVDALCINQEDHREKGHQVGQMRQTYQNAERVIVWLGKGSLDLDNLMDWMASVADELKDISWHHKPFHEIEKALSPNVRMIIDRTDKYGYGWVSSAYTELIERPWFRRIWVIQEVAMARTALIVCGRRSISSNILSLISARMPLRLDQHTWEVLRIMPGFRGRRSWWDSGQDLRLRKLLERFQHSESSIQHDRIYALIGLTSDASDFPVNYQIPFQQLVEDTAIYCATGYSKPIIDSHQSEGLRPSLFLKPLSLQEVMAGPDSREDFFLFIFETSLKYLRVQPLLRLIQAAHYSQRYQLLHMVAENQGIDIVTSALMSHPDLQWGDANVDSKELTKAFCSARKSTNNWICFEPNILLMKRITALDGFIIDVNNFPVVLEAGDERNAVLAAVESSILRQVQKEKGYSKAQGTSFHIHKLGGVQQWFRQILSIVIQYENITIVKFLLQQFKDIYPDTGPIKRILSWSLQDSFVTETITEVKVQISYETAKLLIDHGADVEIEDGQYRASPLWVAVRAERIEIIQLLCENGANREREYMGLTPLEVAVAWGSYELVKLLLGNEAEDKRQYDSQLQMPVLRHALIRNNNEIFQLLLERGADIEAQHGGISPLYDAVSKNQCSIVRLLLEKGANVEAWCEGPGETPLSRAIKMNNPEIVRLLQEKTTMTE